MYFNSLSKDEIKAIKNWIKNTVVKELADSAIKILEADKMEVELMVARNAFILDEMKEKAKAEGKEVGREEGINITKNVIKFFRQGKSIDDISNLCKIPKEEIIEILELIK